MYTWLRVPCSYFLYVIFFWHLYAIWKEEPPVFLFFSNFSLLLHRFLFLWYWWNFSSFPVYLWYCRFENELIVAIGKGEPAAVMSEYGFKWVLNVQIITYLRAQMHNKSSVECISFLGVCLFSLEKFSPWMNMHHTSKTSIPCLNLRAGQLSKRRMAARNHSWDTMFPPTGSKEHLLLVIPLIGDGTSRCLSSNH